MWQIKLEFRKSSLNDFDVLPSIAAYFFTPPSPVHLLSPLQQTTASGQTHGVLRNIGPSTVLGRNAEIMNPIQKIKFEN